MTTDRYQDLWRAAHEALADGINLDGRAKGPPTFFERRRLRKAAALFEQAAAAAPENGAPLLFLGKIEERFGNHEASIAWFSRAQALAPDHLLVALELGAALGRAGRHADSVAVMLPHATAHPGDPRLHCNLGLSLLLAGRADEAVHAFHHTTILEPEREMNGRLMRLAIAVAQGTLPAPRSIEELLARA